MKKIFAILLVSFLMFTFSSVASAEEPTQRVYASYSNRNKFSKPQQKCKSVGRSWAIPVRYEGVHSS